MIKVRITDSEDPSLNRTLEGSLVLVAVLNETENDRTVNSGIVGTSDHSRVVALITAAAEATAKVLGSCMGCCLDAVSGCVESLLSPNLKRGALRESGFGFPFPETVAEYKAQVKERAAAKEEPETYKPASAEAEPETYKPASAEAEPKTYKPASAEADS